MRIDEDYREEIYRKYADEVDEVIYPERLGAIGAKNALLGGDIRAIADIAQNLQLVQLTVTEESPMNGYSIAEVELPSNATMIAFGKDGESMQIPDPDESLETGDRVVVLADFDVLDDVRQLIVGDASRAAPAGGV
jgi:trk system potassium uptake protein TrkA